MRLVLCCIDAKFCKKIFVGKLLRRSTRFTCFCIAQTSICQQIFVTNLASIQPLERAPPPPRASSAGHLRGPPGDEGVPREGAGVGPRRGILFQDARLELQQLAAVHRRELLVRPVYLFLFFVPFFGSNLNENSKR